MAKKETNSLVLAIDATPAQIGAAKFQAALNRIKTSAGLAVTATEAQTAAMARAGKVGKSASAGILSSLKPLLAFAGVAKTVTTIGQFEEKIALAGRVAGASAIEFENMSEKARELGASTRYTASQAAEGMLLLSRAGFEVNESLTMIQDTLDLATAGQLELGEASGFVANSIRQFGLEAYNATQIASTFIAVSNNANTDVRQMAEAMRYAGTISAAIGMSFEETASAIGILGDRGVQGSMAGTQLRGTLIALANPTDKARAAIEKLKINIEDINPATNDFADIAKTLGQGVQNLENPLEAAGLFAAIFGRRQAAAALALAEANDKLQENIELAESTATAHAELADTMKQTLIGKFKETVSAVEELMLVTGEAGLQGILKSTLETVTETARMFGGAEQAFTKASASAKALSTALIALTARFVAIKLVAMGAVMLSIASTIKQATTATYGFTSALSALRAVMMTHPVFFIATALLAVGSYFFFAGKESDELTASLAKQREEMEQLEEAMQKVKQTTIDLETARRLGDRRGEIDAIKERREQLNLLIADLRKAGDTGGLADVDLTAGGFTQEQKLSVTPTMETGELLYGLIDYEKALKVAEGAINDLNKRLAEIDPTFKMFNGSTDLATENLKQFLDEEEALIEHLKQLGDTAKETALIQATLSEVRKQEGDITRKLTEDETRQIREVIEARDNAEQAIQDQIDAEKALSREREKVTKKREDFLKGLQREIDLGKAKVSGDDLAVDRQKFLHTLQESGIDLLSLEGLAMAKAAEEHIQRINLIKDETQKIDERHRAQQRAKLTMEQNIVTMQSELDASQKFGRERDRAIRKAEIARLASLALAGAQTDEERQAVKDLTKQYELLSDELERTNELREAAERLAETFAESFQSIIDGSMSAKDAFRAMYEEILQMVMDNIIKDQIASWFMDLSGGGNFLGGLFGGGGGGGGGGNLDLPPLGDFARGGVFPKDKGKRYGYGGVVKEPTRFAYGGGLGLMGEAGAEAIMPLGRDSKGRLGVRAQEGGGGNTFVVNMNVNTKDADSFRRSKHQIQDDLSRVTTRISNPNIS
tara:strand:+ start:13571 stop:16762 length:3192 start_codon:yes stop_codon:yes gene_type:complete